VSGDAVKLVVYVNQSVALLSVKRVLKLARFFRPQLLGRRPLGKAISNNKVLEVILQCLRRLARDLAIPQIVGVIFGRVVNLRVADAAQVEAVGFVVEQVHERDEAKVLAGAFASSDDVREVVEIPACGFFEVWCEANVAAMMDRATVVKAILIGNVGELNGAGVDELAAQVRVDAESVADHGGHGFIHGFSAAVVVTGKLEVAAAESDASFGKLTGDAFEFSLLNYRLTSAQTPGFRFFRSFLSCFLSRTKVTMSVMVISLICIRASRNSQLEPDRD
jgi:hypothetical protein